MREPRTLFLNACSSLGNRAKPAADVLQSSLLALIGTSNVNAIPQAHIALAQRILRAREALVGGKPGTPGEADADTVRGWQRQLVSDHLGMRAAHFGTAQVAPLADVAALAAEGRDVFVIVKFMDEQPHIEATLLSLLNQDFDLARVVILMVDNNSSDSSPMLVKRLIERNATAARVYYLNQPTPGGGSAARYGTDRAMATLLAMSESDGDWSRLQRATIGVSDGDTVYHGGVLREIDTILATHANVDGVMPFLIYKLTAALRFFRRYAALDADFTIPPDAAVHEVGFSLAALDAYGHLSRAERRRLVAGAGGRPVWLRDPRGHLAKCFPDGQLLLQQLPVSGEDRAVVYLENDAIERDEKWKWHALIGHDLFLRRLFTDFGFLEEAVLPDTSDALKTFRCWSFAIGGQHQLSSPSLKIVTGTDYQSGRVLQAVGCRVALGDARYYAETETDRLAKMVRNFRLTRHIFYGDVRADSIARASGLYLHMTRIQDQVEREIRGYPDSFYEQVAFPERIAFPLRWLLKNALIMLALAEAPARRLLESRVLDRLLGEPDALAAVGAELGLDLTGPLAALDHEAREAAAERLAERIIVARHAPIMRCYRQVLSDWFAAVGLDPARHAWLLDGLEACRCALARSNEPIDPAQAWAGSEFVIDEARGQVTDLLSGTGGER
ncbi:glycosyltransferase family A protein [Burkholderia gladioli]|uniref:glycosyltransferase family A protein n=1 Tax=Burkholderia gladioli TaxID=28095 RepID=UPI00163FC6FE|nr:glycosyltransferase family A protein [Burkholderia gladioli]